MKHRRKAATKSVGEARKSLPAILDAAARGRATIITRRGIAVAAIVPARNAPAIRQVSLLALAGSGKGLWDGDRSSAPARLREEWSRTSTAKAAHRS